jgi:GNAT superfamily N-acetyltransferase
MPFKLEQGDIADLETVCGMLEEYGRHEMKDRLHMELLLSKKHYYPYFATDEKGRLIGIALIYITSDYLWLDFLAVRTKFQHQGYATQMINKFVEMSNELDLGMFIEMQVPEGEDFDEEMHAIKLVEKIGAVRLDIPYRFSSEFVETRAFLYFKPSEHVRSLTGRTIEKVLEHALTEIHSDVFTIEDTIDALKRDIENGRVYFEREPKGRGFLASIFG